MFILILKVFNCLFNQIWSQDIFGLIIIF